MSERWRVWLPLLTGYDSFLAFVLRFFLRFTLVMGETLLSCRNSLWFWTVGRRTVVLGRAVAASCLFGCRTVLRAFSAPLRPVVGVDGSCVWATLLWTVLSLLHLPVGGLLRCSVAGLLELRFRWSGSPPVLHRFPGVTPRPSRRCIRCGSRRGFHLDGSRVITSSGRPPVGHNETAAEIAANPRTTACWPAWLGQLVLLVAAMLPASTISSR